MFKLIGSIVTAALITLATPALAAGPSFPTLKKFSAMSKSKKAKTLYPAFVNGREVDDYAVAKGLKRVPAKLTATLKGEALKRGLANYNRIKRGAFDLGADDKPWVRAIKRGRTIFGFEIKSSGYFNDNWASTEVFDRSFKRVASWGWSEYPEQ